MNTFVVVTSVVAIVPTLVVIWFAWQTVQESRRVTERLNEVITSLGQLLMTAQETVTTAKATAQELASATEAAQQTATIVKLSRDLAEFERKERALRDVEELAERIFWLAGSTSDPPVLPAGWRCVEQQYLGQALTRAEGGMDACRYLADGAFATPVAVMGAARDAQREAGRALAELRSQRPIEVAR
jgi:nitrogen fixation/metabolism regulation signal transduction histidine kinase